MGIGKFTAKGCWARSRIA